MSVGVMAVTSDHEGILFVDGERKLVLAAEQITTLKMTSGQHFVDLRDDKGAKLWEAIVSIPVGTQVVERIRLAGKSEAIQETAQSGSISDRPSTGLGPDLRHNHDVLCYLGRYKEAEDLSSQYRGTKCPRGKSSDELRDLSRRVEVSRQRYCSLTGGPTIPKALEKDGFPDQCIYSDALARELYILGKHDEALYYANEALKYADSLLTSGNTHASVYLNASNGHVWRARVKYALFDDQGALQDLDSASALLLKYKEAFSNEEPQDLEVNKYKFEMCLSADHIDHAIVLASMRRYSEAMTEINAPTHEQTVEFANNIRKAIQSVIGSPGASQKSNGVSGPVGITPVGSVSRSSISNQVDEIVQSGRYTPLPPPQATTSGVSGQTSISIENRTAYELTVMVAGPIERSLTVSAGGFQTVALPPGNYRVVGRVSASNVLPFFGTQSYAIATSYRESFYIQ